MKLSEQIRRNTLALISLFVAFSALGYNTWRNESTEANRNIRQAGFEIVMHIGALQRIAYLAHFDKDEVRGSPRVGWTEVLLIRDLSQLMEQRIDNKSALLLNVWKKNWKSLGNADEASVQAIDAAIDDLRKEVLQVIRELD